MAKAETSAPVTTSGVESEQKGTGGAKRPSGDVERVNNARQPAAAQSASVPDWSDAYARRSYKLGITLKDFKAIPFPEETRYPGTFPVCSDNLSALEGSDADLVDLQYYPGQNIGVIKCQFFYKADVGVMQASLFLGSFHPITNDFYFFRVKSKNDEPILFLISSPFVSNAFDDVVKEFEEVFGPPSARSNSEVQNKIGNKFENTDVIYQNTSSEILLSRYGENLDRSLLEYVLVEVYDRVKKLEKDKTKGPL
ncbi:hypothetical protein [Mesorhizobium sp.]|uniref:hypothetical protein n=1 Tax=Mesorhizobium sp. TaxID=1871066 RepID=UPI000FE7F87F|nr:hypothetical protein [Mesorhizobium sp.]RWA80471.1 MAG: hypothetical protein EOQ30_21920 [Mesorhizobium sp.]